MPTKRKELPPGDFLRAHLKYDPETGLLYRRSTGALATLFGKRYARVSLKHVNYAAHRVIWRMEISEDVPFEIDHFDEDKHNNRLENFRPADHHQNGRNRGLTRANTSGFKGVVRSQNHKRWQAQITVNYKSIYLGLFDDPADAHAAYIEAAKKYHGRYANDGHGPIL